MCCYLASLVLQLPGVGGGRGELLRVAFMLHSQSLYEIGP